MPKNETYQVTAICENCGHTPKEKTSNGTVVCPLEYKIRKGTLAQGFLASQVCPNCGCYRLKKIFSSQ